MSEEESKIVSLKKRQSPVDYFDGVVAGLKMARDAIGKSIENYEQTRELFEASLREGPKAND
jgi:hypothetical protein